jgi:site-specific DNA-methyltransferase (adenine-specific)
MDDDDRAAVRAAGLDPNDPAVLALLDLARPPSSGAASAYTPEAMDKNQLYYGDNLDVLPKYIKDASVDLIYLDPPFNSNRNYSVIFNKHDTIKDENKAQIQAFEDTWHWTPTTDIQYGEFITHAPNQTAEALTAFHTLLGENDAMAYLTNMAPRLLQLRRVLKPTGSIYLHCDPTMSHYLKVLMDAVFDPRNFRNEIVWNRTAAKGLQTTRLARNHDILLGYSKTAQPKWVTANAFLPYDADDLDEKTRIKYKYDDGDGRIYRLSDITNPNANRPNLTYEFMGITKVWRWTKDRMEKAFKDGIIVQTAPGKIPQMKRYLDEQRGRPLSDVWTDISPINSQAAERLGYPTQKPLALLERLIGLTTEPGDIVLDPFCGCGTTVDAAQRMERRWVGIDITYIAVDLITKRLRHTYGDDVTKTFDVDGIPKGVAGARALFAKSPFDFERWAVSLIGAEPNQKQVGDKGIDGVARFPLGKNQFGRILVSVKGGKNLNRGMAQHLLGAVGEHKAEMGVLITLEPATSGIKDVINHAQNFTHPANKQVFPKLQHVTVAELLDGKKPQMPLTMLPYIAAEKLQKMATQDPLY